MKKKYFIPILSKFKKKKTLLKFRMFETNEDMKIMFEQFRTVDNVADLWTSRALENHAVLVMNALDDAITNMDDEQYVIEMLLATGKSHKRFENFNANIFWVKF